MPPDTALITLFPARRRPRGVDQWAAITLALSVALNGCDASKHRAAVVIDSPCDLNAGACEVELDDARRLQFSITPRPLALMQPLQIEAQIAGAVSPTATLDFVGETMDMGINRRRLESHANGSLSGLGTLPVCTTGAMVWRAELRLEWPATAQTIRFRFKTP